MESVQSVLPNGRYTIRGTELPATGEARLQTGQVVPVAWKGGKPVAIVMHNVRRAQFVPMFAAGLVLEELFLAPDPKDETTTKSDVWFRDGSVVFPLGINELIGLTGPSQSLANEIVGVQWGQRADSFVVAVQNFEGAPTSFAPLLFYIFTLDRKPLLGLATGEKQCLKI